MSLAVLSAVLTLAAPPAAEFFPLVPGARYGYSEEGQSTTQEVGKPEKLAGMSVTPMLAMIGTREVSRVYYHTAADSVEIIAYDPKWPLPSPIPVFRLGEGRRTWSFKGKVGPGKTAEPIAMEGQSQLAGVRDVLGKKVEVLIVRLRATVGDQLPMYIEQDAIYARGIGLVEMTTRRRLKKKVHSSTLRLVSYAPPSQTGG